MASMFDDWTEKPMTLAEAAAARQGKPILKGKTRLDLKEAADVDDEKQLEAWRRRIFKLDKFTCRCCGCTVHRDLALVADRAEAHHVTGRADKAVRYDVRNGLTLCLKCHQRVTGAVNDKLIIRATKTFRIGTKLYINARVKVRFISVIA